MLNYLLEEVKIDTSSPAYKAGFAAGREVERVAWEEAEKRAMRISPKDEQIIEIICGYFSTTLISIRRKTRKRRIVYPRQMVCYMLRKYTRLSWGAIAELVGHGDHTTPMSSRDTIKDLYKVDQVVQGDVLAISNLIEEYLNRLNEANPPL